MGEVEQEKLGILSKEEKIRECSTDMVQVQQYQAIETKSYCTLRNMINHVDCHILLLL